MVDDAVLQNKQNGKTVAQNMLCISNCRIVNSRGNAHAETTTVGERDGKSCLQGVTVMKMMMMVLMMIMMMMMIMMLMNIDEEEIKCKD